MLDTSRLAIVLAINDYSASKKRRYRAILEEDPK